MYIYMHVIHNTVAPKEISLFMYQLDSFYSRNKSSNTIQSLYVPHTVPAMSCIHCTSNIVTKIKQMLTTDGYRMDTVRSTLLAQSVCLLFFHWLSWANCPVPFDFHGKWAFLKALKNHLFTCILMNKYILCITNNMQLFFLFTRQYENMLLHILLTWCQLYLCEHS